MKTTDNLMLIRENGSFVTKEFNSEKEIFTLSENEQMEVVFILFNNQLDVEVFLVGKKASCDVKCIYLTAGEDQGNISLKITHAHSETFSKQTIKGIVCDQAHVIFNGLIKIKPDAQKCSGYQNHRAVLLSEKALVQATPELEIYADDVQCSHGSAIGPLEKEALFYLMARGIDKKEAEKMLIRAFLYDLIPENYHSLADEWLAQHV